MGDSVSNRDQRLREYRDRHDKAERGFQIRKRGKVRRFVLAHEPDAMTREEWQDLKSDYYYCCAYCGIKPSTLERDHIVPISRGGRHTVDNIVPCCRSCNAAKADQTCEEWGVFPLPRRTRKDTEA